MNLRFAAVVFFLLQTISLCAQAISKPSHSYDYLLSQIELYEGTPKVWPYLKLYSSKAAREQNWHHAAMAYKEMLHESPKILRFVYADSMIIAARKSADLDLLGSAYLTKGIAHYQLREHQPALENYLVANRLLADSQDGYLRHKVNYSIGLIKYHLGYYDEAIALFTGCIGFFKDSNPIPYLKSLHTLSLCYSFTGNPEMAARTADLALAESARLEEKAMLPYIDIALGINHVAAGRYRQAVNSISYGLGQIKQDNDFASEATANLYLGKAYWKLGQQDEAIAHFREVDRIFTANNYIRADLRESYEYLIRYHHHRNERDIELCYIDRLLKADSLMKKEFSSLVRKVHKEYDTAELVAERQKIRSALKRSHWSGLLITAVAILFGVIVIVLFRRHRRLQQVYRQRFDELINPSIDKQEAKQLPADKGHTINPAIVECIIIKLEKFERKKGFLNKDLNSNRLAESFSTNPKYLSKVIHSQREKSFVNYINDLRVDYLVGRLKEETALRNYNNRALADESGFSTAQHFVNAFKKRTGMPPGYFVEELNKIHDTLK